VARHSIDTQRTADRNALTALLRIIDLGLDVRSPLTNAQVDAIAAWRERPSDDTATAVARSKVRRRARPRHSGHPRRWTVHRRNLPDRLVSSRASAI
jgi:hypothetical protein